MYELMIAIGVLLVAILTCFRASATANGLMRTVRETETATADLQAAMEQILLLSPDQIPIAASAYAANQPIAAFNSLHLRNESLVPTYPGYGGGAVVPDPLSIVLNLNWVDFRGRPRSMQLSCVRTR